MILAIVTFVAGFVIGALVFRNNATKANAAIATAQTDVAKVETVTKAL
jgi:uncharacterized membrane-anchored protein YhcB (DUF1043 family)